MDSKMQTILITGMVDGAASMINEIIGSITDEDLSKIVFQFESNNTYASLHHGNRILAGFPVCYALHGVTQFWSELVVKVPRIKYCSVLAPNLDDKETIITFLSDHIETEVCHFHSQQQMFITAKKPANKIQESTRPEEDVNKATNE